VGQQLKRRPRPALRRAAVVALMGALVFLAGCSAQTQQEWKNLAMPDPATEQADHIFYLWRYAWIAALVLGPSCGA
jgi:cytochrome c oxidase subunit 2